MGSNIHQFLRGLDKWEDEIDVNVGKLHRAVALEGLKGLVRMTPVDKGRARGGWQVDEVPGGIGPDTLDKSGGATVAAGAAKIANVKPYTETVIVNNVPYIEALNNGHSKQAPAGMLEVTANRLRAWLRRPRKV